MPVSPITILPIYLDCRDDQHFALVGGVATLEDDTAIHKSESRTVSTTERSERVLQSWQLSWWGRDDSIFMMKLFRIFRNAKGFLFISPVDDEREGEVMPLRNTVTGLNVGDGVTTTFQLQWVDSLSYSVGPPGTASAEAVDVNYPLSGSVTAYKDGVSAPFTVDLLTGVVTFDTAPDNGVATTADFERAIAVMFTSQTMSRTLLENDHSEVRSAQLEEIL